MLGVSEEELARQREEKWTVETESRSSRLDPTETYGPWEEF